MQSPNRGVILERGAILEQAGFCFVHVFGHLSKSICFIVQKKNEIFNSAYYCFNMFHSKCSKH